MSSRKISTAVVKRYEIAVSDVTIEVSRKRIKNMHLRVDRCGNVTISAPLSMKEETIENFVLSKMDWIRKHIADAEEHPPSRTSGYETGDPFYVWGERYVLLVIRGKKNSLVLRGNEAILTIREGSTSSQREKIIREYYRKALIKETEILFPKWETITGLRASGWQTKYMRTKWGTCNITKKKIWLNVQLASRPIECLEYVILHELVHLKERKHDERFKRLMDLHMPSWRQVKASLNRQTIDRTE
ncbi:MAG: M48 family metallopeptidase [Methanomassiliicoccaceae archaeon]|nr:M48 family metallopeptidase [Methanomassiliicoccaceae archaeon]